MQSLGNKIVFSRNLRRLMDEKGVSAKELSKTLDFPYTTLLSWLKAENYPRIDKIEAMAGYFGVLKSDLIEERMTEEKKAENDDIVGIIVRLRQDEKFLHLVKTLKALDDEKMQSVQRMIDAFSQ